MIKNNLRRNFSKLGTASFLLFLGVSGFLAAVSSGVVLSIVIVSSVSPANSPIGFVLSMVGSASSSGASTASSRSVSGSANAGIAGLDCNPLATYIPVAAASGINAFSLVIRTRFLLLSFAALLSIFILTELCNMVKRFGSTSATTLDRLATTLSTTAAISSSLSM